MAAIPSRDHGNISSTPEPWKITKYVTFTSSFSEDFLFPQALSESLLGVRSFSWDPGAGCGLVSGNKSGLEIPGEREARGEPREHAESPPPEPQGRWGPGLVPGAAGEPGHAAAGGWAGITDTGAGARGGRSGHGKGETGAGALGRGACRGERGLGRAGRGRSRVRPGAGSHGRYSLTAHTGTQSVTVLGTGYRDRLAD